MLKTLTKPIAPPYGLGLLKWLLLTFNLPASISVAPSARTASTPTLIPTPALISASSMGLCSFKASGPCHMRALCWRVFALCGCKSAISTRSALSVLTLSIPFTLRTSVIICLVKLSCRSVIVITVRITTRAIGPRPSGRWDSRHCGVNREYNANG